MTNPRHALRTRPFGAAAVASVIAFYSFDALYGECALTWSLMITAMLMVIGYTASCLYAIRKDFQ